MDRPCMNIESALADIRAGRMLIVVDDEGRENEGDFVMAASLARPEDVNLMATRGRGLLCQAITGEATERLNLAPMASVNTSANATAFTVSVDARSGTSTGISAYDRAATIRALADPRTEAGDLLRPGHVFPLVARPGGVLEREGHTEAACDLARLAGLTPSGILCEIMDDDGTMARFPRLVDLARELGLGIVTVRALVEYRRRESGLTRSEAPAAHREGITPDATEREDPAALSAGTPAIPAIPALRLAESALPTDFGEFRLIAYENPGHENEPHLALVSAQGFDPDRALARVHSECLTGEALRSRRCDCGDQLAEAARRVASEGGIIVYLRQEGRGIGLTEKIRAYRLQDGGADTVDANLRLGHPADARDYGPAAAILRDLGVRGVRLMTNNPDKARELERRGVAVRERIGLEIAPNETNREYLRTKRERFGHLIESL